MIPKIFDRSLIKKRRNLVISSGLYDDFIFDEIAKMIVEKIDFFNFSADTSILNIGARTGAVVRFLSERFAAKNIIQCDLSLNMLKQSLIATQKVVADEEFLPFQKQKFDLIINIMSLHSVNDLIGSLIQSFNCLKSGGVFIGTLFGTGTLKELRGVLLRAEIELKSAAVQRVYPFVDVKEAGNLLQRAGFFNPVTDSESFIFEYNSLKKILYDIRMMAESNAMYLQKPLTRKVLQKAWQLYLQDFAVDAQTMNTKKVNEERVQATYEVITVKGIKKS